MKKLILIGSVDADFFLLLSHILEGEGYDVRMVKGIEEMSHLADDNQVRAVLLDCRPDPFPYVEVCAMLKGNHRTAGVSVIALIGAGAEGQYVDLQRAGAEECFVRPFPPIKLLEYLKALVFSRTALPAHSGEASYGGIEIDFGHHRVSRDNVSVHLGPIEYKILSYLIQRPTEICRRGELMAAVWPGMHRVEERTLNVHIGRLRKRLCENGQPDLIRTLRGVGYVLEYSVQRPEPVEDNRDVF